jgi:hypothetical protein
MKVLISFILLLFASNTFGQKDTSRANITIKGNHIQTNEIVIQITDSPILRKYTISTIQGSDNDTSKVFSTIVRDGYPIHQYPTLILVIDKSQININRIASQKIDPKWIKKIVFIKNEEYTSLYGNRDGVFFIYTKARYRKQIIEAINNK